MKYIVYITYYKGTKLPPWYIGSSNQDKVENGYNGSPVSKQWGSIYKKEQKENKQLFRTKILSHHETRLEALEEELRVQKMHCVVTNEKYFNLSYASINGYFGRDVAGELHPMYGKNITQEHKIKIAKGNKGKRKGIKSSKETRDKISNNTKGSNNPMYGKAHTEESKKKISNKMIGNEPWNKNKKNIYSEETLKKMSEAKKGNKTSKKTKELISKKLKGKKKKGYTKNIKTCPHCKKEGSGANMSRYHFENCNKNPSKENKKEYKKPVYKEIMCPHCHSKGIISNMKRYHFENCKLYDQEKGPLDDF